MTDVTSFDLLIENIGDGYAYHKLIVDPSGKPVDYIFLKVNEAFEQMTGLAREDIIGKKVTEVLPGIDDAVYSWIEIYGKVALQGEKITFQQYSVNLKAWYEVTAFSDEYGYFTTVFQDITREIRGGKDKTKDGTKDVKSSIMEENKTFRESRAGLKAILNFLPDPTFAIDLEGRIILWNQAMEELTGIEAERMIGKGNFEYAIPLYGERRPILIDLALNPNLGIEKNYSLVARKDDYTLVGESFCPYIGDEGIYAWGKATRLYDDQGKIIGAIESIRDITDRKKTENALKNTMNHLDDIIEFLPDATMVIDAEGKVIQWNKAMEEMTGIKKGEIIGKGNYEYALPFYGKRKPILADLALISDEDERHTKLKQNYDISSYGDVLAGEVYCPQTYQGKGAYLFAYASKLKDTSGNTVGAIETIRDITDKKQFEKKIKHLSFNDSLTGLYNRAYLEEEIKRLDTKRQLPISVIMADLNGLKLVNDSYGHSVGDKMLIKAAQILDSQCRKEDIVGRWGGDEFFIFLPQTYEEKAKQICERIREACHKAYIEDVPISLALGTASKNHAEKNISEVLSEAENEMYKQKLSESRSTRSGVLNALLKALESKSYETNEHIRWMKDYAVKLGEKINLSDLELNRLKLLVTLHDIGKINISQEVLTKSGSLDEKEWELIRTHPEIGYRIARSTDEFSHVAEEILSHHERWDGKGYPKGLKGEEIPLLSRIVAIADAYEVMCSGRPYKNSLSMEEIIEEFNDSSGKQFDPNLVEVFFEILKVPE